MPSKWHKSEIGVEAVNPEAHWLKTVLDVQGLFSISARVDRSTTSHLTEQIKANFNRANFQNIPFERNGTLSEKIAHIAPHIKMSQHTFEELLQLIGSPIDNNDIEIDFFVDEIGLRLIVSPDFTNIFPLANMGIIPAHILNREETPGALTESYAMTKPTQLTGDEVIVAIIDDGIGFANERFRLSPEESRVEYFCDLRIPHGSDNSVKVTTELVLHKRQIDCYLQEFKGDEGLIYQKCGLIDYSQNRRQPLKFRTSHGTHILDIATGFNYRDPLERKMAVKRPIIAVQLPSESISERSDTFTATYLNAALKKIRVLAKELATRISQTQKAPLKYLPLVVNFSFGVIGGPHDGEAAVEKIIQAFIEDYRSLPGNPQCEVVIPAGNSHLSRTVAQPVVRDGMTVSLPWRLLPNDKTSSYVQIWLPETDASVGQQIQVSLLPPDDDQITEDWSELGKAMDRRVKGVTCARIYHQKVDRPGSKSRERITIALRNTESEEGSPCNRAGLWTILLRGTKVCPQEKIDVRIRRDDSLTGQKKTGRQSYFDHPDYVRYDMDTGKLKVDSHGERGPVTRRGTLNGYATGHLPIVVGGYRRSDGDAASYSASGPTTSDKMGPTLAAVSDDSAFHRGVLASGTYSGSVFSQNGTSVAAPAITRILAELIECGHTRTGLLETIRNTEITGIKGPQNFYSSLVPERQGIGRYFSNKQSGFRRRIDP